MRVRAARGQMNAHCCRRSIYIEVILNFFIASLVFIVLKPKLVPENGFFPEQNCALLHKVVK
jgi:hypothetical protein